MSATSPRPDADEVLTLDASLVVRCLRDGQPLDDLFAQAFERGLAVLPRDRRAGALAPTTGRVAESVTEELFASYGYALLWHHDRTGRHGVDLVLFHPDAEMVFAVEVKGTLRPRRWPRLSRRDVEQMSAEWLNNADNPGMRELELAHKAPLRRGRAHQLRRPHLPCGDDRRLRPAASSPQRRAALRPVLAASGRTRPPGTGLVLLQHPGVLAFG